MVVLEAWRCLPRVMTRVAGRALILSTSREGELLFEYIILHAQMFIAVCNIHM